jgi:outer membrane immunogenic protein
MKKLALAVSALTISAVGASAADMAPAPYINSPAPVVAPCIWCGWYIGGNLGGTWTGSAVTYNQTGAYPTANAPADVAFANALGSPATNKAGFTGGGQAGYNWQSGIALFGFETDINYLHTNASVFSTGTLPIAGSVISSTSSLATDWLYTLRGRAGITSGPALFYVTGGLAVGNENFNQSFFHAATSSFESGAVSSTKAGWTVGAGGEYAVTINWSVKVEYLYVDLGRTSFNSANNLFPTFTAFNSARLTENIARVGINYRFNSVY